MKEAGDARLKENTNPKTDVGRPDNLPEPQPLPTNDDDELGYDPDDLFLDSVGKDEDDSGAPLDPTGINGDESDDDGMNIDVLVSLFMTCGVSSVEATRAAVRIVKVCDSEQPVMMAALYHKEQPSFVEAYGRGSICDAANNLRPDLNVKGLGALDLRTNRPDGTPWDLSKASHQRQVLKLIKKHKPLWIIGAPPCVTFCALNIGLNYPKMDPADVKQRKAEGLAHLRFACKLYRFQISQGRHFLHEHPAGAASWQEECIQSLMKRSGVGVAVGDQCEYGLVTPSAQNPKISMPAKKHTKFMTTSPQMIKRLSLLCSGNHEHQPLIGGRAAAAAFYPLPLIVEMIRGIRDTADQAHWPWTSTRMPR